MKHPLTRIIHDKRYVCEFIRRHQNRIPQNRRAILWQARIRHEKAVSMQMDRVRPPGPVFKRDDVRSAKRQVQERWRVSKTRQLMMAWARFGP